MTKYRYLSISKTQHGRICYYVRVPGRRKIRLHVTGLDDPRFPSLYAAALLGQKPVEDKPVVALREKVAAGSLLAVCQRFFVAIERDPTLDDKTKKAKRKDLELVCQVVHSNGRTYGEMPFERFGVDHVREVMELNAATPAKANNIRKNLITLYHWADTHGYPNIVNPVLPVKRLALRGDGATPWTSDQIAQFVAHHPPGTKAHLALMLLYWTGARRSDVLAFGRQHVKNGVLTFVQFKGRKKSRTPVVIPIAPELAAAIEGVNHQMVFLHDAHGKPFDAHNFGKWFRTKCEQAGLTGLSSHGVRKLTLTEAANEGVENHGIMALAGHATPEQSAVYTKTANRKRLASDAMAALVEARSKNRIVPPCDAPEKVRQTGAKK